MALTYITHVPDFASGTGTGPGYKRGAMTRPCVFRVVRVSGTIRKAEEEAIRRGRKEVARARGVVEDGVVLGVVGDDNNNKPLGVGIGGDDGNVMDVDDEEEDDVDED